MKPLPDLFEIEQKVKRAAKKKAVRAPLSIRLQPDATVVGIDLSLTSTGLSLWRANATAHQTIHPRHKGLLRIDDLAANVLEQCQIGHAALVVIEGVSNQSNNAYHAEMCGAWYATVMGLYGAGIPVVAVAPMTLKKFVAGTGAAKKEHMMMHVLARWKVQCSTSDEADAIGLAHFGAMLGGLEAPTVAQGECLAKAWRVE